MPEYYKVPLKKNYTQILIKKVTEPIEISVLFLS